MKTCPSPPAAAIFDMDGVLVDSNPFHLKKWKALLTKYRIAFDPQELPKVVLGYRDDRTLRHFFGSNISDDEVFELTEELEESFRRIFGPHAQLLPGVEGLIRELHGAGIPMAVASSGPAKNVEFLVEALGLRPYFGRVINGDVVARSKPDPEIYLRAAAHFGAEPAACVAFEDSFVGVEAAKRAGMKCVAIASSFPLEELREKSCADLTVPGFEGLTLARLRALFAVPGAA